MNTKEFARENLRTIEEIVASAITGHRVTIGSDGRTRAGGYEIEQSDDGWSITDQIYTSFAALAA